MADTQTLSDSIFEQAFKESVAEFQRLHEINQGQRKAAERFVSGLILTFAQLLVIIAAGLVGFFMEGGPFKYILMAEFAGILLATGLTGLKNMAGAKMQARTLGATVGPYPDESSGPPPQFTPDQAQAIALFLKEQEGHPGVSRWITDLRKRIDSALAKQKESAA